MLAWGSLVQEAKEDEREFWVYTKVVAPGSEALDKGEHQPGGSAIRNEPTSERRAPPLPSGS